MPLHVNTYSGGMDRDSSKNKYQPNSYYLMKNMRLTSFDELGNGTVSSVEGNTIAIVNPTGYEQDVIIGWCVIRNWLVAWSTDNSGPTGGRGTIWRTDLSLEVSVWIKIFQSNEMYLSTRYPIFDEAIGYYESDSIIKVYWTDNFNMIRFIDILGTYDDATYDVTLLNILPNVTLVTPLITNIGGGNLQVGKIQYSFQYYNIGGIETTYSPCTQLIHLTQSSEGLTGTNIRNYEGTAALDDSGNPSVAGKSVTIQLNDIDTDYDMVRVIAILYRNLNQDPDIHIVGEYELFEGMYITDFGNYIKGTLTLNAFRTLGNAELYCKTIAQKGNKAVIANITEKFFDIDFDARAYRFGPVQNIVPVSKPITINVTNITDIVTGECDPSKLVFEFPTPVVAAAETNDSMGITATVTHLRIDYTEIVTHNTNSAIWTKWRSAGNLSFIYISDNEIEVHITNFQAWALTQPGFDPTWTVDDVLAFIGDVGIYGTYGNTSGDHDVDFNDVGVGSNIVYAGDALSFLITSVSDFFVDFDHFEAVTGAVQIEINYDYLKSYSYIYETTTSTDVLYSPRNLAVDPINWKFWIDKQTPDPYIPCLDPYDATKITAIHLDMNTVYWYLTATGTRIVVYNSKTNDEEIITTDADIVPWPNSTYTMDGHEVLENHDCINPYNYDFKFGEHGIGGLNPQIDELATYCLPTDFTVGPITGEPNNNNQFKYQSDLSTLGGEGPNVKYEFITTEMIINDSVDTRYTQPQITTIEDLSSFDSFRNPLREAIVLGLKRDEVYRYSLVLTNTKGQDSFVKWIGDIKTPTVKEEPITQAGVSLVFTRTLVNDPFPVYPTITNTGGDLNGVGNLSIMPLPFIHGVYTIRLSGTSGTANINYNGVDYVLTFAVDLLTTAGNFQAANVLAFSMVGINLTATTSRYTSAYSLGIKFSVDTTGLYVQGVRGMRIVRVERTENDRTIYSQGIVSNMFFFNHNCSPAVNSYDDDYNYMIVGYPRATVKKPTLGTDFADVNGYRRYGNIVQFISPEISYFKNLTPGDTDYLKLQSKLNDRYAYLSNAYNANYIDVPGVMENTTIIQGADHYPDIYYTENWVSISRYLSTNPLTSLTCHTLTDGVLAGLVECGGAEINKIQLNSTPNGYYILNRSVTFNGGGTLPHIEGPSGTCLIAVLDTDIPLGELITADEFELYLVDYKRPRFAPSQYGGLIYEARQQNTYIECGPYTEITDVSTTIDMNVYGGDTYIDFYDHIKTMWEADDNNGDGDYDVNYQERYFALTCFPCESYINLSLVHGGRFEQWYTNDYCYAMREDPGTYDPNRTDNTIPVTSRPVLVQEDPTYAYNSVYSQQNKSKLYFAKPYNWEDVVHDETLVKISLEKYPREEVDSFIKFLTDNEKLLPTQFGGINDLFEFKNYMIAFMDHAFGSISIDERALLPIQNNSILELGAGNNLQNFDFISNRSGTIHPQSVDYCGNGFLWYDAYNASMGYYNGETQDIGLVKGFSTVMKEHADLLRRPKTLSTDITYSHNPFMGGNVMVYENQKYKESLCAFVYSEFAVLQIQDATQLNFRLDYSPGHYHNKEIIINGVEYIADTITYTSSGTGSITVLVEDNVGLIPLIGWVLNNSYQIYYKDLSRVYSFSSIINAFMYEIDIMPTWLIEYNNQLYDVYGKFNIWKENTGNYAQFYGDYRNGELEYIINPKQSLVCLFNNHEYAMEAYQHNPYYVETINETWDSVRVSNDYQFSATSGYSCLFQIGTGFISRNPGDPHELDFGDEVMFSGAGVPVELDKLHIYYVIWVSDTNFQVSYLNNTDIPITFAAGGIGSYHRLEIPIADDDGLKRRIRMWRLKDYRDMHGYVSGVFKPRMRDTYQRMKFKYMHGNNKRILMHDFYTHYTIPRETTGNNQ